MSNEAEAKNDSTAVAGNGSVSRDHPIIINNYLGEKDSSAERESKPQTKTANIKIIKVVLIVSILGNVALIAFDVALLKYFGPVLQRVWQLQERNQQLLDSCEGSAKFSFAVAKEVLNSGY